MSLDDADLYVLRQRIASRLDHPSIYMGGPSSNSVRKAIDIIRMLQDDYGIQSGSASDKADADRVRTWRKSPWDSLERI
jgi:hypothetical protein